MNLKELLLMLLMKKMGVSGAMPSHAVANRSGMWSPLMLYSTRMQGRSVCVCVSVCMCVNE